MLPSTKVIDGCVLPSKVYTLSGGGVPGFDITATVKVCRGMLYAVTPVYSESSYPPPDALTCSSQPGTVKSAVALFAGSLPPLTNVNATLEYFPAVYPLPLFVILPVND